MLSGAWDNNTSWEFVHASEVPDIALCTAVYCVALHDGKVVLARNHRGWEMPGGHIEPGETLEEAMLRECLEEGGFAPDQHRLFGYLKLTSMQPVPHVSGQGYYPFPTGYVPHFIATSSSSLLPPTGAEIIERRAFALDEMPTLDTNHWPIIRAGLEFYGTMRAGGSSSQLLT